MLAHIAVDITDMPSQWTVLVLCVLYCCNTASSEDSDSDSDSADSESSLRDSKAQDSATVQQPARVLSDEELNQLGAKILRAEMMGDEVACFL